MTAYAGDFDKIYFTSCSLGTPIVSGKEMRIPVTELFVLRGHPLLSRGDGPYSGWLVFSGVAHSGRTVSEYIGGKLASGGFKEPYLIEDRSFPELASNEFNDYCFEGSQLDPGAWIDNWIVKAESFQLLVD